MPWLIVKVVVGTATEELQDPLDNPHLRSLPRSAIGAV